MAKEHLLEAALDEIKINFINRDFHIFEMSGMRRSNYWQLVLGFYCNKNQKNILHLKQQIHLRLS